MTIDHPKAGYYTQEDGNKVASFANQVAAAIYRSDFFQLMRNQAQALTELNKLTYRLLSIEKTPDIRELLQNIAESAKDVLQADLIELYEYRQNQDTFNLPPISVGKKYSLPLLTKGIYTDDAVFRLIHQKTPLYADNTQAESILSSPYTTKLKDRPPERFSVREKIWSTAVVPLRTSDESMGLMFVNYRTPQDFTKEQQELIELFANQAAIAMRNTRLYSELDMRVQKRTAELQKANEELKELDRTKSKFLSTVSHELRTPLAPIKSCIENMLDQMYGPLTEKQRNRLERALARANEETQLIENLLDLVRIQGNRVQLVPKFESMAKVIRDVIQAFEYKANREQVELNTEFPEDDALETQFDRGKIKQVLSNLIGNAIKFTPERGNVTVSVSSDDEQITVQISDTGCGIPEDELGKIFAWFYQIDSSLTRKVGGTGIGLNIVKEYIELHKGKIWAESKVGEGTTFTFTLPMIEKDEKPEYFFQKESDSSEDIEEIWSSDVIEGIEERV